MRKATTQRGLGWAHRKRRTALLRSFVEGTLCWWCGKPMHSGQVLSADHSIPRALGGRVADRLLHAPCNIERGDGSRDHLRPALLIHDRSRWTSREW
jgi:hypothetical protein